MSRGLATPGPIDSSETGVVDVAFEVATNSRNTLLQSRAVVTVEVLNPRLPKLELVEAGAEAKVKLTFWKKV